MFLFSFMLQDQTQKEVATMAVNPFGGNTNTAPQNNAPAQESTPPDNTGGPAQPGFNNADHQATPAFNNGGTNGGEKITDYAGSPLIIRPTKFNKGMKTGYGETDAVEADWVLLDGSDQGQVHTGLVFSTVLVNTLSRYLESPNPLTLGVIGQGQAKPGQSAPWLLNPVDDSYQGVALQVAQANGWV